jgi:hypothetical protein
MQIQPPKTVQHFDHQHQFRYRLLAGVIYIACAVCAPVTETILGRAEATHDAAAAIVRPAEYQWHQPHGAHRDFDTTNSRLTTYGIVASTSAGFGTVASSSDGSF